MDTNHTYTYIAITYAISWYIIHSSLDYNFLGKFQNEKKSNINLIDGTN